MAKEIKPEWPEEIVKEIEADYIEAYRSWSDTTHGPSLLGTRNDYNRLLLGVLEERMYEYPAVNFYSEEIVARLERIDPYNESSQKIITELASQKETLKMAAYFSEQEQNKLDASRGIVARILLFCFGAVGGIIFFGVSFAVLIYLLINLLK